ncbi:MAG: hypothetical protein IJX24_03865, partial [Oscillospiraceae bacterium]|nr:hypothetical protein [Oscillospiraceae bacterium]
MPDITDEIDFIHDQMIANAEEYSVDNEKSNYIDYNTCDSENNIVYDNPQRPVYLVAADSAGFSVKDGVYTINHTADICDGVSVKVNCSVSNLVLHNDSDSNHTEVYVTGDLEADCSVIADFNEIFSGPTTITLGYVNVAGVGALTLSLNVNLDGKLTV